MSDKAGDPITTEEARTLMEQSNTYFVEWSQGQFSLKSTILPVTLRMPKTNAYYHDQPSPAELRNDMIAAAKAYDLANGNTGLYNPDNYTHDICFFQPIAPTETWQGTANGGGKGTWINGDKSLYTMIHEVAHNFGLSDCFVWQASTSNPVGPGEYTTWKDYYDTMGTPPAYSHVGARGKNYLQWIPDSDVLQVTQSGTYRLYRHDHAQSAGARSIVIKPIMDGQSRTYWLEHRVAPLRNYFGATAAQMQALDDRVQNGVIIDWSSPAAINYTNDPDRLRYVYAVDTKPKSNASNALDSLDAALRIGESFTDPETAITITPLAVGGTSPREWIDVRIDFGATGSNHNPVITTSSTTLNILARTNCPLPLTVSDPDGDTVYLRWDFGDGNVSAQQSPSENMRWLLGGTKTAKCYARDGRGGGAEQSFQVQIEDPLLTWTQRGAGLVNADLFDVVFGNGRFVAVGSNSALVNSVDGITWDKGSYFSGCSFYAVCEGGGRFVAVGSDYSTSPASGVIAVSTDGKTWSRGVVQAAKELFGVAYGSGRYVALGQQGHIFISSDGLNWTETSSPVTKDFATVRFAAGSFVATGVEGMVLNSLDGLTWSNVSLPTTSTLGSAFYHKSQWIITTGFEKWTSANGASWTSSSKVLGSGLYRISALPVSELLVGFDYGSNKAQISEDASTWSSFTASAAEVTSGSFMRKAAEGNGVIVFVGSGGRIFTPSGKPFIVSQPVSTASGAPGAGVALSVTATATGPFSYQWYQNGSAIPGAIASSLSIANAQVAHSGSYSVSISNASGSITSSETQVSIGQSQITALSLRSNAGSGDATLIMGVLLAGSTPKPMIIRALGPGVGMSGTMTDPTLTLYPNAAPPTVVNDNWVDSADLRTRFAAVGMAPLPQGSKDAVLIQTFDQNLYQVHVGSKDGGSGIVLAEVYDAEPRSTGKRLSAISVRNRVGTGDDVLIAGFIIEGSVSKQLIIRGLGPSLAPAISNPLEDPVLDIIEFLTGKPVASNDNWQDDATVGPAMVRKNFQPLASGSKDSATLVTLAPGIYTVKLSGKNGKTGIGLIEIYEAE